MCYLQCKCGRAIKEDNTLKRCMYTGDHIHQTMKIAHTPFFGNFSEIPILTLWLPAVWSDRYNKMSRKSDSKKKTKTNTSPFCLPPSPFNKAKKQAKQTNTPQTLPPPPPQPKQHNTNIHLGWKEVLFQQKHLALLSFTIISVHYNWRFIKVAMFFALYITECDKVALPEFAELCLPWWAQNCNICSKRVKSDSPTNQPEKGPSDHYHTTLSRSGPSGWLRSSRHE